MFRLIREIIESNNHEKRISPVNDYYVKGSMFYAGIKNIVQFMDRPSKNKTAVQMVDRYRFTGRLFHLPPMGSPTMGRFFTPVHLVLYPAGCILLGIKGRHNYCRINANPGHLFWVAWSIEKLSFLACQHAF